MEPNTPPVGPNEPQVQPVQQPTVTPVDQVAPAPTATVTQPVPPMGPSTPIGAPVVKKSQSKKTILMVIALLAILLGVAYGVYVTMFSPAALSKKASTAFMNAATTGDKEKLYKLDDAETEAEKSFLSASSDSVKGTYKLSKKASKNNVWYFLYELKGAPSTSARTEVEKKNGKYVVTGFVYGKNTLALIPGTSTSTDTSTKTDTQTTTTTTSSQCLVATDFDPWYKALYGMTATSEGLKFDKLDTAYTSNSHFKADSLNLDDDGTTGISSMIDLAKSISSKEFKIRLKGSVATTAKSDLDFANKRAQVVKDKLVASGIPASKIIIDSPGSIADYGAADANSEVAKASIRVVVLTLDPTCTGSSTNTDR